MLDSLPQTNFTPDEKTASSFWQPSSQQPFQHQYNVSLENTTSLIKYYFWLICLLFSIGGFSHLSLSFSCLVLLPPPHMSLMLLQPRPAISMLAQSSGLKSDARAIANTVTVLPFAVVLGIAALIAMAAFDTASRAKRSDCILMGIPQPEESEMVRLVRIWIQQVTSGYNSPRACCLFF